MSAQRIAVLVALLVATSLAGLAEDYYTPPVVSVPLVKAAPAVDGVVNAQEWSGAALLSDFLTVGGKARPALPTTVYLAHDNKALYLGAQLFDPQPDKLRREVTERDGEVWRDDCLELFVDTVGQRKSYAHLAVNALGTKYDSFDGVVSEDFDWEVATSVGPEGWSVEIRLPFANGIAPRPGDTWVVEVARNATRVDELSTWGRHHKSFDEPQNFGTLIFSGRPWRVHVDDPGSLWLGENSAFITIEPLPDRPMPTFSSSTAIVVVKLNVRVMGRDKTGHYFGAVKETESFESLQVSVPYSVNQDGFSTVTFSLTDQEGIVRWRSGPYSVDVPPVAETLARAEQKMGRALLAWAAMPDSEAKQQAGDRLEDLLVSWRYLGQQYQNRNLMTRSEVESLLLQAKLILGHAEMLLSEMTTPPPA